MKDTIEKLHATNKARHQTEIKLFEENEKCKRLVESIRTKDELLTKKNIELDDFEKRYLDQVRTCEMLETKKQGIERQFELTKKQLNEKINNLNEIINGEKETREMWIERYEKEQRDHAITSASLVQTKGEYRD